MQTAESVVNVIIVALMQLLAFLFYNLEGRPVFFKIVEQINGSTSYFFQAQKRCTLKHAIIKLF